MKFTRKTEYGLVCLVHMLKIGGLQPVPIKNIIGSEHFPQTFAEKIFQKLRSAGIVNSHQGNQGGFCLARPASQITLREIVEALEGNTFDVFCKPLKRGTLICNHFPSCSVKPIWDKTKELLDRYYDSVNLEMIAEGEVPSSESIKKRSRRGG